MVLVFQFTEDELILFSRFAEVADSGLFDPLSLFLGLSENPLSGDLERVIEFTSPEDE